MAAYALAHLRHVDINEDVLTYMERIQSTLDPFDGRFLVHGATLEVREGPFPGTVVIVEFPTIEAARAWYESPAYQEILPMRTDNSDGSAILVDGVAPGYDASATAAFFRSQVAAG